MESADSNDTHEHGRDRDVSSASTANGLTFMTAPATSTNPTTHVQVSSGVPGASDASLCVEVASPSAITPTTIVCLLVVLHPRSSTGGVRGRGLALSANHGLAACRGGSPAVSSICKSNVDSKRPPARGPTKPPRTRHSRRLAGGEHTHTHTHTRAHTHTHTVETADTCRGAISVAT